MRDRRSAAHIELWIGARAGHEAHVHERLDEAPPHKGEKCPCGVATVADGSARRPGRTTAALAADKMKMTGPQPSAAEMKWLNTQGPKHPAGLPAELQPVLGCIPTMGYHYANLKDMPFGPIYGWYDGKPTFTEIMVDQKLFNAGQSWNDQLKPLPGYKIDHVDFWFAKHGHPGYPIPHYDIHAWYIPASQYMYFCGNKSGKKPAWLGA